MAAAALVVASLVSATAEAQTSEPPRFTRKEAIAIGLASSFFGLGSVAVDFLPAPSVAGLAPQSYYHYGTATLAAVPIAFASPLDALEVGDWTLGLTTADLALRYNGARSASSSLNPYWNVTETLVIHHGLWAGYAAYRDARAAGASDAWNDAWRPYTADELIVAPFHWSNINHPVVWAGISADAGITGVVVGLGLATKTSVLARPAVFARSAGLGTLTSWDAGLTEDPLFRGFFYEELQLALGRWPARAIDMSIFTLSHVPGEVHDSPTVILAGVADRAASGLLFEIAYDQGGLPESVAFHILFDTVDNLVNSIATAPTPPRSLLGHSIFNTPPSNVTLGGPAAPPIHQAFSLSLPL
jgi:membrane protease YdiL (CAAX protease family)